MVHRCCTHKYAVKYPAEIKAPYSAWEVFSSRQLEDSLPTFGDGLFVGVMKAIIVGQSNSEVYPDTSWLPQLRGPSLT